MPVTVLLNAVYGAGFPEYCRDLIAANPLVFGNYETVGLVIAINYLIAPRNTPTLLRVSLYSLTQSESATIPPPAQQ